MNKSGFKFTVILLMVIFSVSLFDSTNKDTEIIEIKSFIFDMEDENLGFIDNVDLDLLKDNRKDLYYFFKPLNEEVVNKQFDSIINYLKTWKDYNIYEISYKHGYIFDYLDQTGCLEQEFNKKINYLYSNLRETPEYSDYFGIEGEYESDVFLYYDGENIHYHPTTGMGTYLYGGYESRYLRLVNQVEKEIFVRVFTFESYILRLSRSECGLNIEPDIPY